MKKLCYSSIRYKPRKNPNPNKDKKITQKQINSRKSSFLEKIFASGFEEV